MKREIVIKIVKQYIEKYKYMMLLAVVFIIALYLMLHDDGLEQQKIKFYGVNQRVDISHTYKTLYEGVYKAYPGDISLMAYSEEGLRIECIGGAIISASSELPIIDDEYEQINTTSEVYILDVWNEVEIKINSESVTMAMLISRWKIIREETARTPSKLGGHLIQIKTDNEKVTAIHLNTK